MLNRYSRLLDESRFDVEEFAAVLAPDGLVLRPGGTSMVGPSEIVKSHRTSFARFAATQHLLTGHDVESDDDAVVIRASGLSIRVPARSRRATSRPTSRGARLSPPQGVVHPAVKWITHSPTRANFGGHAHLGRERSRVIEGPDDFLLACGVIRASLVATKGWLADRPPGKHQCLEGKFRVCQHSCHSRQGISTPQVLGPTMSTHGGPFNDRHTGQPRPATSKSLEAPERLQSKTAVVATRRPVYSLARSMPRFVV